MELPEHIRDLPRKMEERLAGGKICFISLTGSRAFGWADEESNFDWDIHGVFAKEGYWDTVHSGEEGIDLNLWELGHLDSDIRYQHFESFMNWANPIFIDGINFDYVGLYSFCTPKAAMGKRHDILQQVNAFKTAGDPRSALHAYRIIMVPIHWLRNRAFELNVFKLDEIYGYGFPLAGLKDDYNNRKSTVARDRILGDLDKLLVEYDELCGKADKTGPDMAAATEWLAGEKKKYYG